MPMKIDRIQPAGMNVRMRQGIVRFNARIGGKADPRLEQRGFKRGVDCPKFKNPSCNQLRKSDTPSATLRRVRSRHVGDKLYPRHG
jgi:hypothetical protein